MTFYEFKARKETLRKIKQGNQTMKIQKTNQAHKAYLTIATIFLVSGLSLNISTWPKTTGALVGAEFVLPNSEDIASQAAYGYGLITAPVSLGTDNFYWFNGPDFDRATTATNKLSVSRTEFKGSNFIPREYSTYSVPSFKGAYMGGFDKGYIQCSGMGSTVKACRSERDASQFFQAAVVNVASSSHYTDQISHHKYRPLINMFVSVAASSIYFYEKHTDNSGFKVATANPVCKVPGGTVRIKIISINFNNHLGHISLQNRNQRFCYKIWKF